MNNSFMICTPSWSTPVAWVVATTLPMLDMRLLQDQNGSTSLTAIGRKFQFLASLRLKLTCFSTREFQLNKSKDEKLEK